MNNENPPVVAQTYTTQALQTPYSYFPSLCWGAIIGGTIAAIGIHILLSLLGVGAGLAAFEPTTNADSVKHFSEGAAAVWTGCALVSLFFGAVIAGRFSKSLHNGFVHGILVWSITLIITLLLVSTGTGVVVGGAFKILGESVGMGTKAVASGLGDVVKEGAKRGSDQLTSFISEASQSIPTNAAPKDVARAQREIGFAVTKLFTPGNDVSSQTNRAAVIKALVEYTHVSEADATKTVDEWTTSYKDLQAEVANVKATAEQKAKETADETAQLLSSAGIWTFFALLIGMLVSAGGGVLGADFAVRQVKIKNIQATPVAY
jgi:hypothetical protein